MLSSAAVAAILDRDLQTLRREIEAYPDERQLWQLVPGVTNSAGTLALHLAGNLRHYVGARFGGTGYVRDRPAEFSRRDVPRAELVETIEAARVEVQRGLARVTEADLEADYPEALGGVRVVTQEFLVHLAVHLAYHLGQIDYHRRVATGAAAGVDAVRVAELASARAATA